MEVSFFGEEILREIILEIKIINIQVEISRLYLFSYFKLRVRVNVTVTKYHISHIMITIMIIWLYITKNIIKGSRTIILYNIHYIYWL